MHAAPETAPQRFRIGDLILDVGSRRVTRNGELLKLGGLTFDLLQTLAEASPSMVSYDVLAERVWQGRPVSPETIAQRAKMLRDALSDDARSPRYLELVRGQGYRLVADAEQLTNEFSTERSRSKVVWTVAALASIALFFVLVTPFEGEYEDGDDAMPSVAVLPFADMSKAGDQQYLADGVAEELINQLAQLEGLEVASRTESFSFRDGNGDLQDIGARLDVTAILEGSIRRSEDDIRITVQLIDVHSGFHLWSESFDRELDGLFTIQDEIALAVAGALGVHLGVGTVNEFFGAGTRNFEAYEAFLRGDFAKAMQLDPEYAAAWGGEGVRIASTMWANPPEDAPAIIERAYIHVKKATELDPQSSQARTNFATLIYATMAWEESEASFMQALSLRRNAYTLAHYANMLMRAGRSARAEAIHNERKAMLRLPVKPHPLDINVDIALGQLSAARQKTESLDDESRRFMMLTIALNEDSVDNIRAAIDELAGNRPDYRELFGPIRDMLETPDAALEYLEALANDPTRAWPHKYMQIALVAAYLGDPDFALEVFSRELPHTAIRYGALWFPVMTDVRKLPAFKDLVTEVNLVAYWQKHGWPDFCWPQGTADFVCE